MEEVVGQKIMQAFLSKEVDGNNVYYSRCDCLGFIFIFVSKLYSIIALLYNK